jgi:outer membrane murein-binding lipoprotein Lpp
MKKAILLASVLLAVAALAGCAHPNDITDEIASIAAPTSQA